MRVSFERLFCKRGPHCAAKLRCVLAYFRAVAGEAASGGRGGALSFHRVVLGATPECARARRAVYDRHRLS